ncbi:DNA polymerase lambda-like [Lycorma delicatula]|uniref:DNA polymerase lambda-like n=1 Tax=Lycorma delicatula TaxID=130591 RepID=UPI003F514177
MPKKIKQSMSCNINTNGIFSGTLIYLCKANLSKTRYTLFEDKIKINGGLLTNDPKDYNLTHVIIEDNICDDVNNCLSILKKAGFVFNESCNFKVVKVEWICECLQQKQNVDTNCFQIKLPLNQDAEDNTIKDSQNKNENTVSNDNPPESKRMKQDLTDSSKYVCSQPSLNETNLHRNQLIINELRKLADAFRSQGDQWRSYSYEKAISAIKNYNKEITSYEEAKNLPGIGDRMALKVKEMLEEGHIRKVDEICGDEKSKVLDLFSGVWGAGPATVQAWYQQGFRTLEDLQVKATLTKQQKVGLKYYNEIQDRMPRSEVENIAEIVKMKVLCIDKSLKLILCGSYRRGKEMCGDVDIVIVRPDHITSNNVLYMLHKELTNIGFITDDLTTLEPNGNEKKFLGMCKLPGENQKHRRLDIFVVKESESATGIMHYTGSALFNRSIRLLATRKGMCLSEHALSTDVIRVGTEVKNAGVILPTPTEESIFEHLGLEYRPPEQRDH